MRLLPALLPEDFPKPSYCFPLPLDLPQPRPLPAVPPQPRTTPACPTYNAVPALPRPTPTASPPDLPRHLYATDIEHPACHGPPRGGHP